MKTVSKNLDIRVPYWGSEAWADGQLKYMLGLLGNVHTWILPHNRYCKRIVAEVIIGRFRESGFEWHALVGTGHLHRWYTRVRREESV